VSSALRSGWTDLILMSSCKSLFLFQVQSINHYILRGIQRLQDGTWPLLATNWPSFLYAADAIYDSEDPNIGLFRGHAGIRVCSVLSSFMCSQFS
jgi:hypothetical protein